MSEIKIVDNRCQVGRDTKRKVKGEINSGMVVTQPNLSLSIQDILQSSINGEDVNLEPIKDICYEMDFVDLLANQDELNVLSNPQIVQSDESVQSDNKGIESSSPSDGNHKEGDGEQ